MTDLTPRSTILTADTGDATPLRLAESVLSRDGEVTGLADFDRWFRDLGARVYTRVQPVPLDVLDGWERAPDTGNLRHLSSRFFTVEGLEVHVPHGPVPRWSQPIINQPEVGILGVLAKEFGGVPHFLMQAKVEPGNINGLQLSPTVQATRSNYTRVHHGKPVPYLDYFRDASRRRVLADVRQSEQGSAFHHKRNRNMVVEVDEDVEPADGFCWLSLGQMHRLLAEDDLVNMDARTVLACLPFAHPAIGEVIDAGADAFRSSLIRSCNPESGSLHPMDAILSWITEARSSTEVHTRRVPLDGLPGWRHTDGRITHETGRFFDVIGVDVEAGGREVARWSQPMIEPHGTGIVAFLVRPIDGVLHALVNARVEAGYVDVVELAPTVQCTPGNYRDLPAAARPSFLDEVLTADPFRIRFASVLSEEGGRFRHARNRYLIVETNLDAEFDHPGFRWMTLHQLTALLRHSHYVNIQARSLVACLHSLSGA